MRLLFKQKFFSWFDSYSIYNENDEVVYIVEGELAWGHRLKIYDAKNNELAELKQKVLTILPEFQMYLKDEYIGSINKEFTFLKPRFNIDYYDWHIDGDFLEWDYKVLTQEGDLIAEVSKELFRLTDTYIIDIKNEKDALPVLMIVLAIDIDKCSRNE